MPTGPKSACPVCRRLRCDDPSHKPKPWAVSTSRPTRERRPGYAADQGRRAAFVRGWVAANGRVCPRCGRTHEDDGKPIVLSADHVHGVGAGGGEGGELRVLCCKCNSELGGKLGARIAAQKRRERG